MPARRKKKRSGAKNYYRILGISPEADQKAIKKAFRRKARQTHPDKKGGDERAFRLVKEAYETLSDPHRRDVYDLRNGFKPSPPPKNDSPDSVQDEDQWPDFEELAESFAQFLEHQWWDEEDYKRRRN